VELAIPESLVKSLNASKLSDFVYLRYPGVIEKFGDESTAWEAGLREGDQIVAVDSIQTPYYIDVQKITRANKGKTLNFQVKRKDQTITFPVQISKEGKVGIQFQSDILKLGFKTERKKYTFAQSIPAGWNKCWNTLGNYVTGLKHLFTGKANPNESLGSVISIGKIFPKEWGEWEAFWRLTAIFSIILAFMNVLPIPALDGGHALFTLIEMITGKKPSDKFMEYAQMVGMVLLLGLMAYALGLDFLRLFRGN
jgi:regulator of sigma E protease